jgi:hypothetical protein
MTMALFGDEGAVLQNAWKDYVLENRGDLTGPFGKFKGRVAAQLFENTKRNSVRPRFLTEDIPSSVVPNDNKMIFPLIRKVIAGLVAFDLCTVQPLSQPNGQAFVQTTTALRARGNVAANTNLLASGNFSKFYSSEYIEEEPLDTGDAAQIIFNGTLNHTPVKPYNATKGDVVTITDGTETFTDDGAGVLTGDAGGSGTIDYATGDWSVTFNAAPANGDSIVASYWQNMEGSSDVGEMSLSFTTVNLTSRERRLLLSLPLSTIEDMMAQMGVSAEGEMTSILAQWIATEIDREIVGVMLDDAEITDTFTYAPASASVEMESIRAFLVRIGNISADIHRRTRIAPANFIVAPPAFVALLDQLSTHANFKDAFRRADATAIAPLDKIAEPSLLSGGSGRVMRVGTLNNRWTVYQDPLLSDGVAVKDVLIGLRGDGYYASGCVYAPFVPVSFSETQERVETATRIKGIRTRYALKVTRPEFYAKLSITGLQTFA